MTCLRWRKCPTGMITGGRFMNRTHLNKSREKNKWTKSSSLKMFKANVHIHLVPECCRNNTELTLYCCMFNLHWTVSRNGFRNVPFLFFSAPFRGNHSSLGLLAAQSSYFGAKAEHGRRALMAFPPLVRVRQSLQDETLCCQISEVWLLEGRIFRAWERVKCSK